MQGHTKNRILELRFDGPTVAVSQIADPQEGVIVRRCGFKSATAQRLTATVHGTARLHGVIMGVKAQFAKRIRRVIAIVKFQTAQQRPAVFGEPDVHVIGYVLLPVRAHRLRRMKDAGQK